MPELQMMRLGQILPTSDHATLTETRSGRFAGRTYCTRPRVIPQDLSGLGRLSEWSPVLFGRDPGHWPSHMAPW